MARPRIDEEDAPFGHRGGEKEHKDRRALALTIETIATRVKSGENLANIAESLKSAGEQAKQIAK